MVKTYRSWAPWMAILPALILFFIFKIYPALGTLFFSMTDFNGNIDHFKWVGLKNYKNALTINFDDLMNAIKVSFTFAFFTTVIQNIVGVALAVLVNLKIRGKNVYRSILFMPNVLGVVIIGLVWTLIFDPYSGPMNQILSLFGTSSSMLGDSKLALPIVIFVQVWTSVGYAMILYLAGLQGISQDIYEAGSVDGAVGWKSFRYLTLPLLQPIIGINILLSIIGSLRVFDLIMILTNGGPDEATMTLGMFVFKTIFDSSGTQGYASALGIIHFLVIAVVVVIVQTYMRRREEKLS
ncbi:raffinose/stachyose/melibiose transport system permease protein [Paenibacillus endophyticus]|uniref:Raffinose/stachyose/melibiose transport system permease protein n=1 Tax=Paenibacillus endophyticus TaxID=1294268 RepID=A0A7W5C3D4_9BACL|nr:sugar ABC transporter permease [Paenibacillus endophyticus]MBB3150497.1 raffinose/stachyose/melibiose transport system permease protein [Paenibacillus endophyticus]